MLVLAIFLLQDFLYRGIKVVTREVPAQEHWWAATQRLVQGHRALEIKGYFFLCIAKDYKHIIVLTTIYKTAIVYLFRVDNVLLYL